MTSSEFGRVDEANNVYLIDGGQERIVGQYPNVPAADALSYFTRKFDDLDAQVRTGSWYHGCKKPKNHS